MAKSAPSGWFPRRGEVYWVALDKNRPAAILSLDALNKHALDVCVVPFTTVVRPRFSLRIHIRAPEGGLARDCWAKCDQVTTLEKAMLVYPPIGLLSRTTISALEEGVRLALGLTEV